MTTVTDSLDQLARELEFGNCDRTASRRESPRVAGPFDGRRVGALTTPLRIHDLSAGGCLIESHHEVTSGRRLTLQIDLPGEGWITLQSETLYMRENYGFAVKFIDVDEGNRARISRTIERLLCGSAEDDWSLDPI